MKISGEVPKVLSVYNTQKNMNRVAESSEKSFKKDGVSISSKAKDFQTVLKALKDVPDIRQAKVTEFSDKYSTQKYNVSSKDMADKILNSVVDRKV